MGRNFVPSKYRRLDKRHKDPTVQVPLSVSDEKWLDQFIGKIQFWSFGFFKVKKDTVSTKFRVYTRRRISRQGLSILIKELFEGGCTVTPVFGYKWRNTFDVKLYRPMRWDQFIFRIVKALQDFL
jgi:hypothetical protein